MSQAAPFIRPYDPKDWMNGLHIFSTTADPALHQEPSLTISSYLYYRPYVALSPSTCFVLDDGAGRAVGYVIGTPDTLSFAQRWRDDFTTTIDSAQVPRPDVITQAPGMKTDDVKAMRRGVYAAECSMLQSSTDTPSSPMAKAMEEYPAHLHIDILPAFQRKGWGVKLLEEFFAVVRGKGVKGVHLGVLRDSKDAVRFYEREEWKVVECVIDGGESGELGVSGKAICLVKGV